MQSLRQKPLRDWSKDDLDQIVAEQWSEDVSFEIKEAMPLNNGAKGWFATSKLHNNERDGVAKEIVAFANARGGMLIVGIEESDESPKRAKRLAAPLPRVSELADRLSQALSALIDPPLRGLEVQPISSTGDDGYLVLKVPLSNLAPHGFGVPAQSYVRKQDRSEPMSMRELQATFWESRTRIERMDTLRKEKQEEFEKLPTHQNCFVYRLTAVPDTELQLTSLLHQVHNSKFLPIVSQWSLRTGRVAPWPFMLEAHRWRPDLNGVRAQFQKYDQYSTNGYWEIDTSGAVSVVGEIANTYSSEKRARTHAAYVQATCADLLTVAWIVSQSVGLERTNWAVDGEIYATSFDATVGFGPDSSADLSVPKFRPFRPVPVEVGLEPSNLRALEEAISSALKVPAYDAAVSNAFDYNLKSLSLKE